MPAAVIENLSLRLTSCPTINLDFPHVDPWLAIGAHCQGAMHVVQRVCRAHMPRHLLSAATCAVGGLPSSITKLAQLFQIGLDAHHTDAMLVRLRPLPFESSMWLLALS
jgi:hypothetical protein